MLWPFFFTSQVTDFIEHICFLPVLSRTCSVVRRSSLCSLSTCSTFCLTISLTVAEQPSCSALPPPATVVLQITYPKCVLVQSVHERLNTQPSSIQLFFSIHSCSATVLTLPLLQTTTASLLCAPPLPDRPWHISRLPTRITRPPSPLPGRYLRITMIYPQSI